MDGCRGDAAAGREERTLRHFYPMLIAMGLLCGAAPAAAADLKIGFIDAERINRESAPAERASKQLEKESVTMSETDRRSREQELARMSLDYQRMQREYREDLNLRRNQELSGLFERANRVIKQIAEAEKFDLILQEAVYRSPRIDITEKVLKALAESK